MKNQKHSNPVAVITGAGRGIGKTVAMGLAEDGYRVCLLARTKSQLQEVAELITRQNKLTAAQAPLIYSVDVSSEKQVNKVIADIIKKTGRIDVLFNNAGIAHMGTSEMSPAMFNELLQVNLVGAFNMIHAIVPQMKKQKSGYIFNLSSAAGKTAHAELGGYCASKFGLVGLSDALYLELVPQGIGVATLCPGVVATDMTANMKFLDEKEKITPQDILMTTRYLLKLSPTAIVKEVVIECKKLVGIGFTTAKNPNKAKRKSYAKH